MEYEMPYTPPVDAKRFFNCKCGKLHTVSPLDKTSYCSKCGRYLWEQMLEVKPKPGREFSPKFNA